ncbi:MAG: transketolase [Anaerolineales bacterium]|nr:MAG: transketolase [Anaerolineales bacterium]
MSTKHSLYCKAASNIRKNILETVNNAGSGHIGGSFSIVEILVALYFSEMKINISNPSWEDRDRLVLSKGHASPALYSVLAEKGFFAPELLKQFRSIDSPFSGHADMHVPGVDMSTGSLGQGLSVAVGMALAGKATRKEYRVFCILGDGELEEGQIWEAAMSAGHFQLGNLVAIVDNNGLQIDGAIQDIMSSYPIDQKFEAFNWNVICIDGHDYDQIIQSIRNAGHKKGVPTVIVAKTIKGRGVSFMENNFAWHGKPPSQDEYTKAMGELRASDGGGAHE